MSLRNMQVAVVGAGIVGAAVAYHLASRGAKVRLFEEGAAPGSGVTGQAFGWINVIAVSPSATPASYRLCRESLEDYRRLRATFAETLPPMRLGSLLWKKTTQETEALVRLHREAGTAVELIDAKAVADLEPHLRIVPECAVFSPEDIAVDPAALAQWFTSAAVAAGASVGFGEKVVALEMSGSRAVGLRTAQGSVAADLVILAGGPSTGTLVETLGLQIGLQVSPALLLRYGVTRPLVRYIVCGPDLEIRQRADHSLVVAEGYADGAPDSPEAIGRGFLDVIKAHFPVAADVALLQASVGRRPTFADGLPRLGFLPGTNGIYLAAGHPGVILAPLLGRLAADEVIDGRRLPLLPDFAVSSL